MNTIGGKILLSPPESLEPAQVAPGVYWLRLTAVKAPLGGVNVWLIADGDGWAVIDTGFAGTATMRQWELVLRDHVRGPVTQVICTHYHPDHLGQAATLSDRFGAPLRMTPVEWEHARAAYRPTESQSRRRIAQLARIGMNMPARERRGGDPADTHAVRLPDSCEFLTAGMTVRIGASDWVVTTGAGHSPGAAILTNKELGLVISGDQLLCRITPHIGVDAEDIEGDPLGDYLAFLHDLAGTDSTLLALPGHGPAFSDIAGRAREIIVHHQDRLTALERELSVVPKGVPAFLAALFGRELSGFSRMMGLTEAHAHLNHLVKRGRARRKTDEGGHLVFSAG